MSDGRSDAVSSGTRVPWRPVSEADVTIFAGIVPLHEGYSLSSEEAAASHFGSRIAPGMLTLALSEGLADAASDSGARHRELVGLYGVRLARPVRIGDLITVRIDAVVFPVEMIATDGHVWENVTVRNQRDEVVMSYTAERIIVA